MKEHLCANQSYKFEDVHISNWAAEACSLLISDIKVLYPIQTHLVWFPAVQQIHTRPPGCFTVKVLLLGFGSRSGSESVASFKSALKLISNGLFSFDEVTSDMFYFQVFSCIFFFAVVVILMFGSLCKSSALACQTTQ